MNDAVINVQALKDRLGEPTTVVIDVRWTLGVPTALHDFEAGHIPGAHYVDMDTELAAPPGPGGRHPLPDPATVAAALRRCGVSDTSRVVVYDAMMSMSAARAWWVFRDVGLQDVVVLDGGLAAWVRADLPLESGPQPPASGTFDAAVARLPRLDADATAWVAQYGVLLDARAPERFSGEQEPIDPVAGHIPGALCAPTTDNLNDDGTFRTPQELRERFADFAVHEESLVGSYCGSGVTAAHQILALHIAGIDAALYPGSWSEWITDPTRPVATGAP